MMNPYTKKAARRILIATGISILPGLVLLGFGISEYRKPPNYTTDPDPELNVIIPLFLMFFCGIMTCATGTLIAAVYYSLMKRYYIRATLVSIIGLFGYTFIAYHMFPQLQNPVLEFKAKIGSTASQHELGIRYLFGRHLPQDENSGVYWLTKAAEKGHLTAQLDLGRHYLNVDNLEEAKRWIEPLANSKADTWQRLNAQSDLSVILRTETRK